MKKKQERPAYLRFGSYTVRVARPGKILFPVPGYTKLELVEYYRSVGPWMVPHLRNRPLVMHRFPDGIEREGFYHKDTPDYFPDWVDRVEVKRDHGSLKHVVCQNTATLTYLAGQACITPHVWPARIDDLRRPDRLVFDLDPPGGEFAGVRTAALLFRTILEHLDLSPYVQTTGSRGAHIVVPIRRMYGFAQVREFASQVAAIVESTAPDSFTTEHRKARRRERIFIDVLRNAYAQTSVPPYAVRARPGAPVATPLTWEELEHSDIAPQDFTIANVPARLQRRGDPWAGMGRRARSLRDPAERVT